MSSHEDGRPAGYFSVKRGSVALLNRVVLDNTLSSDARFLLMYMLALREEAPKGYREMMLTGMGETRARRALKELEERRHRWRFNVRVDGRIKSHTAVFDEPVQRSEAEAWIRDTFGHIITSCPSHPEAPDPVLSRGLPPDSPDCTQSALSRPCRGNSAQSDKGRWAREEAIHRVTKTPSRSDAEFSRPQKSRAEKTPARLSNERHKEPKGSQPNQARPARESVVDPKPAGRVGFGLEGVLHQDTADVAAEDWDVLIECLPPRMRRIEPSGIAKVAAALRKRVEAGWTPDALRAVLAGNSLPPDSEIQNLTGIVSYRIGQIPVRPPKRSKRIAVPSESQPTNPTAVPLALQKRAEARAKGSPDAGQPMSWWFEQYPPTKTDERGELA